VETVGGDSDYHLLTDGRRIYLENSEKQIVDILKNARQPMFAICVSDAVRQVRAELRKATRSTRAGTSAMKRMPAKLRA
ncbi:MAG: hypothetical protein JO187_11130, partial [Acidobacteria bacterium]|nr:hypothetical protein [Acidobacteriota bacterium]